VFQAKKGSAGRKKDCRQHFFCMIGNRFGFKGVIRVGLLTWRIRFPDGLILGGVRLDFGPESR
jgi:hypothetical protein